MITLRTLPQLKSFLKRNGHLNCSVENQFRNGSGFRFRMVHNTYEEYCNHGDHEWTLVGSETVCRVMFVPKGNVSLDKHYMINKALSLCSINSSQV